jgi:hypothetical protein
MDCLKRIVISGVFFLAALLTAIPLPAAEAPAAGASEPNPAMEQVMRMANFLAQLKEFGVTLKCGYDVVQESGQKIEFGEDRKMTIVRPDRFRVDMVRSDGESFMSAFDGKTITVFSPKQKMYAATEAQGDTDTAIQHLVRDLKIRIPLAMLWVTTLPRQMEQRLLDAEIVETSPLQDTPCFHIAGRAETVDFQLWLPTTGDPLPRRIVLTYKNAEGQPQFWANFSEWNLAPNPPATLFTLDIPKDAQRIEFLSRVAKAAQPAKPAAKKGGKK